MTVADTSPSGSDNEPTSGSEEDDLVGAGDPRVAASVFQVLAPDGGVAGAGFLVGDDIAFTCAHVVCDAGQAPGGQVEVVFPNLPDQPRSWGRVSVEEWRAPEAEDVAVLHLESVPASAGGMALGTGAGTRGHRVTSFGFPAQAPPGGHHGYGRAGDMLPDSNGVGRLLQLSAANDVTTGFSGGPVVDEVTGLVIGMVTSIASPDDRGKGQGIAYATPTEVLREVRPALAVNSVCPYLGLEPFTSEHADWFHGREAAVESVLAALEKHPQLLMLLGPSGAGKSSLVKAGVLPRLADGAIPGSDRWLPLLARPGQDLVAELEDAGLVGAAADGILTAAGALLDRDPDHDRLLLVIDQFEELFTQPAPAADRGGADARLTAAEQLVELKDSRAAATVVLIMRNDFYAPLNELAPDLMNAALPGLTNIPATLSVAELRDIVTKPAAAVGLRMGPNLAERIVDDVVEAGGGARQAPVTLLPPLELALLQLWERRTEHGGLTHAAYRKLGKITGSMTAWCNTAVSQMPADQQLTAQRLLAALVRPADEAIGIPATRQPVPLSRLRVLATDPDLDGPAADVAFDDVLAALTRYRIVTTDTNERSGTGAGEATAELIHDALVRDWSDLRDWVAQDHKFQLWLRRAAERQAHHAHSGLPGDLLDGTLLAEGLVWANERPLPPEISAILAASQEHQQADLRRTRRINAVLAGLLTLALIATGIAVHQQRTATTAQREAQSRQLAAQSANLRTTNPDVASLLAVKAWKTSHTDEAAAALYAAPAVPLRSRLTMRKGPTDFGRAIDAVTFSPDGDTLVTAGGFPGAALSWDVKTGRVRTMIEDRVVNSVQFSPDGETLAIVTTGGVALRDVQAGKFRTDLDGYMPSDEVSFSPDGRTLATAGEDGDVRLWNVKTGKVRTTYEGHDDDVKDLAFSPDGKTIITGSKDETARLWDVKTGKVRTTFEGHESEVIAVAFSPDRETVATVSLGDVRLWDAETGKVRNTFESPNTGADPVAFSPDGETLATGNFDGTTQLWDVRTGQILTTLRGHTEYVRAVAFSPDGRTLATASGDGTARLWNVETGQVPTALKNHDSSVNTVAFSPDGKTLATGSEDETAGLWDAATGKLRNKLRGHTAPVYPVAFSPDGKTLATGSFDGTARLWNIETGKSRIAVDHPSEQFSSLAFSPDGTTLATADNDNSARLWDVKSGRIKATLGSRRSPGVSSLAFSPDGTTLATGSSNGDVRLWGVASGKVRTTLSGHSKHVDSVAFSPDGKTLTTGSDDGDVRLWDAATGKVRRTLAGASEDVDSVAFSPDGKTLASAGYLDRTARLWDVQTGKLRAELVGLTAGINSLAFSPDGKTLATGQASEVAQLWSVDLPDAEEVSDSICKSLHRNFTKNEQATHLRGQDSEPVCPHSPPLRQQPSNPEHGW